MKTVNKVFLEDILSPLVGGADIDDMDYFEELDPNNEAVMKEVISDCFLPYFRRQSLKYQDALKCALRYYLTVKNIDFGRLIYSNLLPFKTFSNPALFYEWMWDIFWPGEDFYIDNIKDYIEKEDMYEPARYSLKK